jgi:hypothetical protein
MQTIQLSAATLASLIHDLNHASDNDQPVSLTIEDGLMVKTGDSPWEHYASSGPDGDPAAPSRPTLYPYLDLSTAVLPADELADIEAAPPRVTPHEYGAWVHVMDDDDWPQDDPDATEPPAFAHLRAVLRAAHELGAQWINLDCDGVDVIKSLPTFDH